MKVSLTLVSGNRKVGPIPTSMSTSDTCPASCPFAKAGCYAKAGPVLWHWRKLDAGLHAMGWDVFCAAVKRISRGSIWRHNVAGDLPGKGESIDGAMLAALVTANRGRRGFTYTHKHVDAGNHAAIKAANDGGFTVNLSANNIAHADQLKALGIGPVACVIPSTVDGNQIRSLATPGGNKIVVCPATYREGVTCLSCGLCQRADRSVIVGFPAHGTSFKRVDAIAMRHTAIAAAA